MRLVDESIHSLTEKIKAVKQGNFKISVALVPDRFAFYRYNIFKLLSDTDSNQFRLKIYADTEEDIPGLRIVDSSYCDTNYKNGGISWVRIKNFTFRQVCFWQSGLILLALSREHEVHVYWGEAHRISTWISVIISKILGKKIAFWSHGIYGNEGRFKLFVRRKFYQLADAILLYSDYGKQLMVHYGFNVDHLYVIKNSLDTDRQNKLYERNLEKLHAVKSELFTPEDRVILFVGRLEPQKKLELLLQALSDLKSSSLVSYKLLLIGNGTMLEYLNMRANELGLQQDVVFYGECFDDEKLAPLIMMADLCVSPGEVGLTAMHSLIYGTPVITHDNFLEQMPEFEAIIPNVSGAFYKYDDVSDLSIQIGKIIQFIDDGVVTRDGCRRPILEYYNPFYQQRIFNCMVDQLFRKR